MGYIFDALNKKNSGQPADQTPDTDASDIASPLDAIVDQVAEGKLELNEDTTTAEQALEPLRLSDLQLSMATDEDGNTIVGTDVASEFSEYLQASEDQPQLTLSDQSMSRDIALTDDLSIDEPIQLEKTKKASWWNRLLGRHLSGHIDDRLVAMTSPASAMSEEYRSIRTSILARHDNERHLVHTITSATPQEGKTITCVNLGLTFAELRNRKTIIIECDLRLPTFGKLLNCDTDRPGLIDYLRGDAKISEIVQQIEGSPLHIIPAGGRVSDEAVQLISGQRMSHLIQGLRAKYDHVIIDTPPVLQLADAGILGSQSEEVLVVARMRRTPRPLVEQAINTLTSYNAQVNGIIATDNPRTRGRGYGYKYGYRYGYGYAYGYTSDKQSKKRRKRDAA